MKRETRLLKLAVFMIGLPILALCLVGLPWLAYDVTKQNWDFAILLYPILVTLWLTAIPFFFALTQAFRLLGYIDQNKAFSPLSLKAIGRIKHCATLITSLFTLGLPFFYFLAEKDDAPGVILIGLILIFASFVIAVFAALLQKLLANAIEIKSEHDLTV